MNTAAALMMVDSELSFWSISQRSHQYICFQELWWNTTWNFFKYDISNEQLVILINDDIFYIKPSNVLRRYKALLSILFKRVDQYSVEDPYDL